MSGLDFLPGLDSLVRCADGTVPALVLAAFLAGIDVAQLDFDAEVLDVVVATDRLNGWVQAMHYQAVAEFVRRPVLFPAPDAAVANAARRPVGQIARDHGGDELGAALGLTVAGGEGRGGTAVRLVGDFPATLAALASGRIDHPRMSAMLDEAGHCTPERAAQVEAAVLDRGRRGTRGQFRRAVRRTVLRVDAAAAAQRAERARAEQWVRIKPAMTDTAWLDAHLNAEDALAIRLALDAAALRLAGQAGETRTKDQLRAAALAAPFWAALATGELAGPDGPIALAVAHGQTPALELTLSEPADPTHPGGLGTIADLGGYGPITGGLGRDLACRARTGSRCPIVRVVQPVTSDQAAKIAANWPEEPHYRPSAALRRHITARDRTCPHPSCHQPAARGDIDHTIAWPAGPTHPANLSPPCRRHHRFKQHRAVHLAQPTPGHFIWTMPTGHHYTVGPPADDN